MSDEVEHVLAGFAPFGLRRVRALCSCGFRTRPVDCSNVLTGPDAAAKLLRDEHGARDRLPGERVGLPLVGGTGPARPAPAPTYLLGDRAPRPRPLP